VAVANPRTKSELPRSSPADLINDVEVVINAHNDTKKMYVVASSDDGYKAVFSWQEILIPQRRGHPGHS
jgi:hypothetical protein